MSKMKEQEKEKIISTILKHHISAIAIYLFGSYSSGENNESSDIDIAVLLPSKNTLNSDLLFELESIFGKEIDLINLRESNTVFQKEVILADNKIFCSNEYASDEFEMLVISKYQKLNEERKEIIKSALKTGTFIST